MKNFLSQFERYCEKPGVKSNKAGSYAKAIQYLFDFLGVTIIDEQTVDTIKIIEKDINDRNSSVYSELLAFLENRRQKSYLESGFIRAALKYLFLYNEILAL